MRNSKTKKLAKGLSCTVLELSVADIISFLSALDDALYDDDAIKKYFAEHSEDMLERAKKVVFFNQDNFEKLIKKYHSEVTALFFDVNKSYFDSKNVDSKRKLKNHAKKSSFLAKKLRDSTEVLIREGHVNVADYGWECFQNSIKFQEQLVKDAKAK